MTENWSDMSPWMQSMILGYDQIRQFEEADELRIMASIPRM